MDLSAAALIIAMHPERDSQDRYSPCLDSGRGPVRIVTEAWFQEHREGDVQLPPDPVANLVRNIYKDRAVVTLDGAPSDPASPLGAFFVRMGALISDYIHAREKQQWDRGWQFFPGLQGLNAPVPPRVIVREVEKPIPAGWVMISRLEWDHLLERSRVLSRIQVDAQGALGQPMVSRQP